MINPTAALISLSLYILIWEKIPYWGNGLNNALERSPRLIRALYAHWRCPFCVAFWMALFLYLFFDLITLPDLFENAVNHSILSRGLSVFLDCLSCSSLVYFGHLLMSAVLASTLRGHEIRVDYQFAKSPEKTGE